MPTETLTCTGCGAPLVPGQSMSHTCAYCGRLNYIRVADTRGAPAKIDLRVEGVNARFTDAITVTTSAPACLGITSMVGSSITGSLSISLTRGDLRGRSFDVSPQSRNGSDFVINVVDMTVPTTFTNMWSLPSIILGESEPPPLGGVIHVDHFDLSTGQTKLQLVDVRLAKLMSRAVCTLNGSIQTFRSANPIISQ